MQNEVRSGGNSSPTSSASPIRKSFVAFRLAKAANEVVIRALEGRYDPKASSLVLFEFGKLLSESIQYLPEGEFALGESFYKTGEIVTNIENKYTTYPSLGAYVETLKVGQPDPCESEIELKAICHSLAKSFADNGIDSCPSEQALVDVCLGDMSSPDVQHCLERAFCEAKEKSVFDKVLYDAMDVYHTDFTVRVLDKFGDNFPEDTWANHAYEMMPFGLASADTVAAIYSAFLPLLLYANVSPDRQEFFTFRIESGREKIRQLTGGAVRSASSESLNKFRKFLEEDTDKLVPYFTPSLKSVIKSQPASFPLAIAIIGNLWPDSIEDGVASFVAEMIGH